MTTNCACDTFNGTTTDPSLTATNSYGGKAAVFSTSNSPYGTVQITGSGGAVALQTLYVSSTSFATYGIYAEGAVHGILGKTYISGGKGVLGQCTGGGTSYGICGEDSSTTAGSYGVYGISTKGIGVYGTSTSTTGTGVYGYASATGTGVVGVGGTSGIGVWAQSSNAASLSLYASGGKILLSGPTTVAGYLTKAGGGFRIDHPTDPENKYLNHEFVESDYAKNVYDGEVVLDKNGEAVVKFDSWFEHINANPRMTVSPRKQSMPDLFWDTVDGATFKISGGKAGGTVAYIVQCKRADAWQEANHPGVEMHKAEDKKGKYMHPELYGKTEEHSEHPKANK